MTSLLQGSLAKTIGSALSSTFLDATLTRLIPAVSPDPADPQPPTQTTFPCKAINDAWGAYYRTGGLVGASDRQVLILASTLATVPQSGDRITIDGATLTIVGSGQGQPAVSTDPAKAVWTIRASA